MPIKAHLNRNAWLDAFHGRESEFNNRLFVLSPPEDQHIPIHHFENECILNRHLHSQASQKFGPAEALVLEDVIYDNTTGDLHLPFMQGYDAMLPKVDRDISEPHNSALCVWEGYGHLLLDQLSLVALYEKSPATQGLPLALNSQVHFDPAPILHKSWTRPTTLVREKVVRFRKLFFLIHDHHQVRRCQGEWMQTAFGLGGRLRRLTSRWNPQHYPKRLYLARVKARRFINEGEVHELLSKRGFTRWEDQSLVDMTIQEQARLFQEADIIVSPQGSQLINCFFCQPAAVVIECHKFCWMDLSPLSVLRASAPKARYGYTVDWQPWETGEQKVMHADMRVPTEKLEKLLNYYL